MRLLGLDIGTSRIKALLYDVERGQVVALSERPTPLAHPQPGWTDFPPEAIWQAAAQAMRELASDPGLGAVRAVSVSSLAESGVPLDAAGRPLAPFMAWFDARSKPQAERWARRLSLERIYRIINSSTT